MCEQPVIADADARAPGNPEQEERQQDGFPVEEKWSSESAQVKCSHDEGSQRPDGFLKCAVVFQEGQEAGSLILAVGLSKLTAWRDGKCNSCVTKAAIGK